jgi:TetR/AcrR family transcriptional repressor of nem operon
VARDGTANRERILDAAQGLVLERGFAGTSVDAVIAAASTSKGGFFHHFRSKNELGLALLDRYAAGDIRMLDEAMAAAEAETDDPAEQIVALARRFEQVAAELVPIQPGCLFVSFIYERELAGDGSGEVIVGSIRAWRERLLAKLEAAARVHPPAVVVDLRSLADQFFTVFEGGYVVTRALDDPAHLPAQLAHLRHYLELLFGLSAQGVGVDTSGG